MTAAPQPVRHVALSLLVVIAIAAGLWFALFQSVELTQARRNLPPGCIQALADISPEEARTRGVPLRECAKRRLRPQRKVTIVGRWSYGPAQDPVEGFLAWQRDTQIDGTLTDRLMHVRVVDSNLVLNEFEITGQSCAGGIKTANLESDSFGVVLHLTPRALMAFSNQDGTDETLIADPQYCAAQLVMVDRRPLVVQLNTKPLTATGAAIAADVAAPVSSRQRCLGALIAAYVKKGQATLSYPDAYTAFVDAYSERCTSR